MQVKAHIVEFLMLVRFLTEPRIESFQIFQVFLLGADHAAFFFPYNRPEYETLTPKELHTRNGAEFNVLSLMRPIR
jgi:hypothetical protein